MFYNNDSSDNNENENESMKNSKLANKWNVNLLTSLDDIEYELKNYFRFLRGKTIFCCWDDVKTSQFVKYFSTHFHALGLKELIVSSFQTDGENFVYTYTGERNDNKIIPIEDWKKIKLKETRSFGFDEMNLYFQSSDIIITTPPSNNVVDLFVKKILEMNKKFIINVPLRSIKYPTIFSNFIENDFNIGFTKPTKYKEIKTNKNKCYNNNIWMTNLQINKDIPFIDLENSYIPKNYLKYDEYNAINVNRVKDIPKNYSGAMGVPLSFIEKFNFEQFELLDAREYKKNNSEKKNSHMIIPISSTKKQEKIPERILIRFRY